MNLSPSFIENLQAGLVFWIFDVIVIVLLLPTVLDRLERRKWLPMRQAIVRSLHQLVRDLVRAAYRFDHTAVGELSHELTLAEARHRARMETLIPAVDPELSQSIVDTALRMERLTLLTRRLTDDVQEVEANAAKWVEFQATSKIDNYHDTILQLSADIFAELRGFDAMIKRLAAKYGAKLPQIIIKLDGVPVDDILDAEESISITIRRVFFKTKPASADRRGRPTPA